MQRYRCSYWERVRSATERGKSDDFARHIREKARPTQIAYQRLMAAYNGNPVGIECKKSGARLWAFVLPDVSGNYPWRIQMFDPSGFGSHLCYGTFKESVEAMISMGFREIDAGALDRVASTPEWALGVRQRAIVKRHQEGIISYSQMFEELSALQ